MKQEVAQQVMEEVKKDQRLQAVLEEVGHRCSRGYRVRLWLRGLRVAVVATQQQWQDIQEAWRGL